MRRCPHFLTLLGTLLVLACKPGDETSGSSDSGTSTGPTGDVETSETETLTETETEPGSTTDFESTATTDATTGPDSDDETESPESDTDETTTDTGSVCSNGILEEGEECDDGVLDEYGPCVPGCLNNVCGDGLLWVGVEDCDAGTENGVYAGSCGEDCTTESIPKCGDGILQEEYEVCEDDDTNQDGVACDAEHCTWGDFRYVFVTSLSFTGGLATPLVSDEITGVARADAICQALAGAGQLPGKYSAWLSDNNNGLTSNAADRIGGALDNPNAAYVMPKGGVMLAKSWSELVSDGPAAPITQTEAGEPVEPTPLGIWTNTNLSGNSRGESACGNWSTTDGFGWAGLPKAGPQWTDNGPIFCGLLDIHLYCVQGME